MTQLDSATATIPHRGLRRGVDLSSRQRWGLIVLSLAGVGVSSAGIVAFVLNIVQNNLPWDTQSTIRDHYLAVGDSFSQGFLTGFFLCFFLSLVAVAVGSWADQLRRRRHASDLRAQAASFDLSRG